MVGLGVLHWGATNALYELFCVILVPMGLDLVLIVLVGRAAVVDNGLAVVDNCSALLAIVLEMVGYGWSS